jgi:riboflavin-specific deaminase-like protein
MSAPDPTLPHGAATPATIQEIWGALLMAARWVRQAPAPKEGSCYAADSAEGLRPVPAGSPNELMQWQPPQGWIAAANVPPAAAALLDLYLPICNASVHAPLTVGHLGQGLDGYIATSSGDSNYVTGPANLLHLHRMRALCDAVLVGAETVAKDDPQLTVRRAGGSNPVRVILDPQRRLTETFGVFTDGDAPTLLVCDAARAAQPGERVGTAEVLGIPRGADGLDLDTLLNALHARQLYAVFVEGGGKTVSAFLEQGLLDRLQIAVAALVTGAGRPGITLPARQRMHECLRLPHRVFTMGDDVLFDCDLRRVGESSDTERPAAADLIRVL